MKTLSSNQKKNQNLTNIISAEVKKPTNTHLNDQNILTDDQINSKVDFFPGGVPNLPEQELKVLNFWQKTKSFEQSVNQRPQDKQYVFYDGPPFATGMPHYGHLLGSTSKDVIPRYWTMKGYRVERVWGWDCHGLPIENMIEKKLGISGGKKGIEKIGIDNFNSACRAEVLRLDKEWEKIIARLGRWVDFEHNYKTMDNNYMESVWWGFKQLHDKNFVYEGRKVVLYCPRCATPLSNFEIAMDNSYQDVEDNSVYIKFKVSQPSTKFTEYFLAWTTTPWTLPGNVALAVQSKATYDLVAINDQEAVWLAHNRIEAVFSGEKVKTLQQKTGAELIDKKYEPLFPYVQSEKQSGWTVLDGDFVSLEDGTGIVHTAALFGEDDYKLAQKKDLPLVPTLDDQGKFLPFVELVAGQFYKKAELTIIEDLEKRNLLFKHEKYKHSYPFCYRCATPLYFNAVPAWFIDVQQMKISLIKANKSMSWYPKHLKEGRFGKGLATAPDWNISRSRYWGTPMPIWEAKVEKDGAQKTYRRIIGSLAELRTWAVNPKAVDELSDLHREFLDALEIYVDDQKTIIGKRIPEVFDCWVESGSMPFASKHYPFENKKLFEQTYPAQFVSEYIAQTRAWFYTMHVMSVGIFGQPAVEHTLTTGTILAEDGSKMSKSKNNYPDPMKVIDQYGVDSLRLYLMSSTVMKGENLNFSEKEVSDLRKKVFVIWYNCLSFYKMLQPNLTLTFDLSEDIKAENVMDKWLIARINLLIRNTTKAFDQYDVVSASREIISCINDLSTWYLRRSRERLKADPGGLSTQIFGWSLVTLAKVSAPITPFFAEFVYHQVVSNQSSIHLTDWPTIKQKPDLQLLQVMKLVREVVEVGLANRATASIKVRQPLTSLEIKQMSLSDQKIWAALSRELKIELIQVLKEELNVKNVVWPEKMDKSNAIIIELDTQITPQLKAEGEARELIRSIQQLRKKESLHFSQLAKVEAPSWPEDLQLEIETKTNVKLSRGDTLKIVI